MNQPIPRKGHPKGLYVLFATEMWERFNYYGMRAILILFMTKALLFGDAFASNLYGSYISLIFLTPLIGGYIADRYWGNQRAIISGGLIMAVGELLMFVCGSVYQTLPQLSTALFYSGLGFMIAGNGFFKPNISSLVGQLYPKNDIRKDSAYTIFYMGINVGGALGPILCGLVGDTGDPADFKWAFLVAGIGMLISVVVQLMFHKKYVVTPDGKPLGHRPANVSSRWTNPFLVPIGLVLLGGISIALLYIDTWLSGFLSYLLLGSFLVITFIIFLDKSLSGVEKKKILVIFSVSFFVIFFWAAFEQTGASLTFFADRQTQRDLGFYTVPPSLFQSLNSLFILALAPIFAWFWMKLGRKQPSSPTKMAIGLSLLALGYLWIAVGVDGISGETKVSIIWLTGMYLLHTMGELCLSPIGLSLVNQLSPVKFASLLMAVWFLANAAGNKLAGVLSALYPDKNSTYLLGFEMKGLYDFFILFVIIGGVASVLLFLIAKRLQKLMELPDTKTTA